jgi:hypothetical protein
MNKVELEVASNVTEKNKIMATEPGKSDRYLVTLKAIPEDQIGRVKELFLGKTEVPIEEANGILLTASIWVDEDSNPQLPMKGEKIYVSINWVNKRSDGTVPVEKVLRATATALKPADKLKSIDLDSFFEEAKVEEPAATAESGNEITHS